MIMAAGRWHPGDEHQIYVIFRNDEEREEIGDRR
jgi:hypothetical protein